MWPPPLEISAAQIGSVTEISPPQPLLCVNRSPIRYGFRGGAKAVRYSVNTYPICDFPLKRSAQRAAQLRSVTEIAPPQPFLVWIAALSGMIFVPALKLSGKVWTKPNRIRSSTRNCSLRKQPFLLAKRPQRRGARRKRLFSQVKGIASPKTSCRLLSLRISIKT